MPGSIRRCSAWQAEPSCSRLPPPRAALRSGEYSKFFHSAISGRHWLSVIRGKVAGSGASPRREKKWRGGDRARIPRISCQHVSCLKLELQPHKKGIRRPKNYNRFPQTADFDSFSTHRIWLENALACTLPPLTPRTEFYQSSKLGPTPILPITSQGHQGSDLASQAQKAIPGESFLSVPSPQSPEH